MRACESLWRTGRATTLRFLRTARDHYSTRAHVETVHVPVRSNGIVELRIHSPGSTVPPDSNQIKAAIYLSRGILQDEQLDALNIGHLRSVLPYPVVHIDYRRGRDHPFPAYLHDVLAGYDYVVENLLPKRSIVRASRSERIGQLVVCGELLGGQLATMLALTECRVGEPGICAAAVSNPVLDWVDLFEETATDIRQHEKASPLSEAITVEHLLQERRALFRKAEHYFDPFASPLLFFRSSGFAVADESQELVTIEGNMEELVGLERAQYATEQSISSSTSAPDKSSDTALRNPGRKASRRFPSKSLGLRLPRFHISAGSQSDIESQAAELTKSLRQSSARLQRTSNAVGLRDTDEAGTLTDEDSIVKYVQHEGHGLWNASRLGRRRFEDAATWLRQI